MEKLNLNQEQKLLQVSIKKKDISKNGKSEIADLRR
jgi:hypothetical protein